MDRYLPPDTPDTLNTPGLHHIKESTAESDSDGQCQVHSVPHTGNTNSIDHISSEERSAGCKELVSYSRPRWRNAWRQRVAKQTAKIWALDIQNAPGTTRGVVWNSSGNQ
ncbi:hypothetical protein N7517_006211 [Penicillium concentricum]|uniref:Uncharacterized protein n=1 Tax=Penicillium concentricum TaxID=293559 RepID=A0A9W9SA33_9EURO|nr:uncharacterized protein N7517_006211 [Penicillium concentricum]KAJ5374205.1 hypothetical protein N7517_006211 [Penicillium concentricum]